MTNDFQPFITLVDQILAAKQNPHVSIIPAEAGIQSRQKNMDSRFHGNDISGISVDTSALERQIDEMVSLSYRKVIPSFCFVVLE